MNNDGRVLVVGQQEMAEPFLLPYRLPKAFAKIDFELFPKLGSRLFVEQMNALKQHRPRVAASGSKVHNLGLIAIEPIAAGTFIRDLYDERQPIKPSALIDLEGADEANIYIQIGLDAYIMPPGDWRYINHSCVPNVGLLGGVIAVALRDIRPGDELSFDYSTTMRDEFQIAECLCGERECRHRIEPFVCLPYALQQFYSLSHLVAAFCYL
jgi:uncharacterized protein